MAVALLVIRLVLAAVFAVAGAAKLFSYGSTLGAATGFGVPRRLAPVIAIALPIVELAVAVALFGRASARVGVIVAAVLIALFLVLTSAAVARGRTVSCNCFGNLSASSVDGRTVLRNAMLLAVAAPAAALTATESAPIGIPYGRFDDLRWTVFGLVIALLGLGLTFWRITLLLLEQHGRLLVRLDALGDTAIKTAEPVLDGLPVGSAAPAFALETLQPGEQMTLDALTGLGRSVLLVFGDPGCGPCTELAPSIAHWQREHTEQLTTVLVATGARAANVAKAAEHGLLTVLLDTDGAVARTYQVPGTPSAVLIDADGRIAAPLAAGGPAVESLVASVTGHTAAPPSLVGTAVPAFTLTTADGAAITNEYFARNTSTVVLFWSSGCGFCQRMRVRLQQWDLEAFGGERGLLVVSSDAADAADRLRLNAPVVHDDGVLMRTLGVTGTPIAVLIDSAGVIASELAPGEQAVFDLLGPEGFADRQRLPVVPGGGS